MSLPHLSPHPTVQPVYILLKIKKQNLKENPILSVLLHLGWSESVFTYSDWSWSDTCEYLDLFFFLKEN